MASTAFNASVAYDKSSYNAGEVMTITLTGNAVFTGDPSVVTSPVSVDCTTLADNGVTTHLIASGATFTTTTPAVPQTIGVVLSSLVDTSGRVWTIQPGGKSAKATA